MFQTSIDPRCAYCTRGRELDQSQIICPKKGVMSAGSHCPSFRYDPLKRVPPRPAKLTGSTLEEEAFTLVFAKKLWCLFWADSEIVVETVESSFLVSTAAGCNFHFHDLVAPFS